MKTMDIKRKKLDVSLQSIILPEKKSEEVGIKDQEKGKTSKLVHIKKEKSRNAARTRRGKENYEFYELARLLPISADTSSQLDKASIVRLTMCHLQLQNFLQLNFKMSSDRSVVSEKSPPFLHSNGEAQINQYFANNLGSLILQSLDGFLFVLNGDGRFLYVSSTVTVYLGLAQVDLIGTSIYNYIHPSDHEEVENYLTNKPCQPQNIALQEKDADCQQQNHSCSFFVRMRSTLSRRGLSVKTSGYKVIHITGNNRSSSSMTLLCSAESDINIAKGFVGIGHVMPPPSLTDVQSDVPVFVTRLDPSLVVNYCEERVKALTSYDVAEIKGWSLYQFIHSLDIHKISSCHKQVLAKGQIVTPYYRWVLKNGSYIWVQSYATLLVDRHQSGVEDAFVWINYVLGSEPNMFTSFIETDIFAKVEKSGVTNQSLKKCLSAKGFQDITSQKKCVQQSEVLTNEKQAISEKQNLRIYTKKDGGSMKAKVTVANSQHVNVAHNVVCITSVGSCNAGTKTTHTVSPCNSASVSKNTANILDDHSKIWLNPPNREVSNHSDLPPGIEPSKCSVTSGTSCMQQNPSVIHHHYPLGINPNLLQANPVLAKMLAPTIPPESYLSPSGAIIFATPVVNIMSPVFAPLPTQPGILPSTNKVNCCPTSIASILEELRKDPMRKVNPPNKVVLPTVEATQSCGVKSLLDNEDGATDMPVTAQGIAPYSLQYCGNEKFFLGNLPPTLVLQPISISRKFNSFPV